MNKFSANSLAQLSTCHEELQSLFNQVLQYRDCTITCGFRGEWDKNNAFRSGASKVRWPNGKHNTFPSMAVDAFPYMPELKKIDFKDLTAIAAFAGRVLQLADELFEAGSMKHRLRWGGDWDGDGRSNDQTFMDLGHFELVDAV